MKQSLYADELAPRRKKPASTLGDFVVEEWVYKPLPRSSKDDALIAILDAPLHAGETAHYGFQRKERELGEVLATLTVVEANYMRARLANPKADDPLALKFARLTHERRARLIAFVADTRRRQVIAASGR